MRICQDLQKIILLDKVLTTVKYCVMIITMNENPVSLNCSRCHKPFEVPENEPRKSRCAGCLEYARNWQKSQTKMRRQNKQCITCGKPSGGPSHGQTCSDNKSNKNKTLELA